MPRVPLAYYEKQVHVGWLFNHLLRFRQDVYRLASPSGGMDQGFSAGLYYSIILSERLKKMIRANTADIDAALCLVIDPKKREISREELVRNHAYPDVDLDSIDLKWRTENY